MNGWQHPALCSSPQALRASAEGDQQWTAGIPGKATGGTGEKRRHFEEKK